MSVFQIIWELAYGIIQVYWIWAVGFMGIFALASFLPGRRKLSAFKSQHSFLVLIPAYKEDQVILHTAAKALNQSYPQGLYRVGVIADSLQGGTLDRLAELPIDVVKVSFEKSTKAKALRQALAELPDTFDGVVILDADNVMDEEFLQRANSWLGEGALAVQGRRVAKNAQSRMAILDGISEEINNRVYCKGHNALGFSSKLSGSGMVFAYATFVDIMQGVDAVGGFDKELELKYTQRGHKVYYDHHLKVRDEKVGNAEVFGKQRRRWLSSQYHYFQEFISPAFRALLTRGNIDFFNRAAQLAMPPRLLMPVFLFLASALAWIAGKDYLLWSSLCLINVLSFIVSIPKQFWTKDTLKSLSYLPRAIFHAMGAVLQLRGANKTFIHTPHGVGEE